MSIDVFWNWTFKGFLSQGGNVVQVWYERQQEEVQADFSFTLKTLRTRSPQDWGEMKKARRLKGEFKTLTELKFETNRNPYRPIGFMGVGRQTFTILAVATKHDFNRECAKALTRQSLVIQNPGANSDESDCLSDITRKA